MRIHSYSIRHRIIVLTVIPLLVLIVLLMAFYYVYHNTTLHQAENAFLSLAHQNEERITSRIAALHSIAQSAAYSSVVQTFLFESSPSERVFSLAAVRENLDLIAESMEEVQNIVVRTTTGNYVYNGLDAGSLLYDQALFEQWNSRMTDSSFVGRTKDGRFVLFYPASQVRPVVKGSTNLFSLVAFDTSSLLAASDESNIEILHFQDELVACSAALSNEEAHMLHTLSSQTLSFRGQTYYAYSSPILPTMQFRYTLLIPRASLTGTLNTFWNISLAAIVFMAMMQTGIMLLLLRGISYPISLIVRDMASICSTKRSIHPSQALELNELAGGINRMLEQLNRAQASEMKAREASYQAKLEKSHAENIAYRSQINPHFLFNTLECMAGMANYYKAEPLCQLISALSSSFRYSLRAPMLVKLSKELEHLDSYMQIMSIRFPERFYVRKQIENDVLSASVPSLLLQPLAENAVLHGFEVNRPSIPCFLHIRAWTQQNKLLIRFTDNGIGIENEKVQKIMEQWKANAPFSTEHMGLNNIWKRLKLAYGEEASIQLRSRPGYYTQLEIAIPQKYENQLRC